MTDERAQRSASQQTARAQEHAKPSGRAIAQNVRENEARAMGAAHVSGQARRASRAARMAAAKGMDGGHCFFLGSEKLGKKNDS